MADSIFGHPFRCFFWSPPISGNGPDRRPLRIGSNPLLLISSRSMSKV